MLHNKKSLIKQRNLNKLKAKLLSKWAVPKEGEYFNFKDIGQYFIKTNKDSAFQVISDQTAIDLDINKVFQFIDRTSSKIGQQYLYYKLSVNIHLYLACPHQRAKGT